MQYYVFAIAFCLSACLLNVPAASARNITSTYILAGDCLGLMAFGDNVTEECDHKVLNNIFSDGRIDFTFSENHKGDYAIFGFSGDGNRQVNMQEVPGEISQPIDKIIATFGGKTTVHPASGTCNYGEDKKHIYVICRAETDQGKFMGLFKSNGHAPKIINY